VWVLNSHWAVGDDGALQWLLLRRAGNNWHPRRFHVERDALLRSICELCGAVDAAAIATIRGGAGEDHGRSPLRRAHALSAAPTAAAAALASLVTPRQASAVTGRARPADVGAIDELFAAYRPDLWALIRT
jgi:hypothetical protein